MKGNVTNTGYWPNSPDRNNDFNIIPSSNITTKGMDIPLIGISDTGDIKKMVPGKDYKFDGNYVTEFPMNNNAIFLGKYKFANGGLVRLDEGGETDPPKKSNPIYVDSKNDPRYKAYADSLLAYNLAPIYNRSILNNLEKANTVDEAVKANLQTNDDFYKKGMNFSLGFNRREFPKNEVSDGFAGAIKYDFKKPVQPVEVRKGPTKLTPKEAMLPTSNPEVVKSYMKIPDNPNVKQTFGSTSGYSAGSDMKSKFQGNFNLETGEWSFKEKKPVNRELTLQQPFKEGGDISVPDLRRVVIKKVPSWKKS